MAGQTGRRLIRVAFGIVLALVALEVVLQLLALVIQPGRDRAVDAAAGGVLCIGDSFTFGFGADDPENSYPRELDRQLDAAGIGVDVVNSGWPGRDSAATLRLIPDQLAEYSPRVVYLLVGYNDFWSGQPDEPGFFSRLRTVRFARMLWHWAAGSIDEDTTDPVEPESEPAKRDKEQLAPRAEAPFLGPWHAANLRLIFREDSSIHTLAGNLPFLWNWDGSTIFLRHRETDELDEIRFSIDDDQLTLSGGPFGSGTAWTRGIGEGDALERALRARDAGRTGDADRLLAEALLDPGPRGDDAWLEWVRLRIAQGETQVLAESLPALTTRFERSPATGSAGRALIEAMLACGRVDDLEAAFSRFVRTQPAGTSEALFLFIRDQHETQLPALQEAVLRNLRDDTLGAARLTELWALHVLFDPNDSARHAGALVASLRFDIDNRKVRRNMTRNLRCSRDEFAREVEIQETDPARQRIMLQAFDDAAAGEDTTLDVLWKNLESILRLCRESGAEVVLLNYPDGRPELASLYREFAEQNGLRAIDIHGEFRRRVDEQSLPGLFIFDGHCNDAGYQLMGQIVAEDAVERLR